MPKKRKIMTPDIEAEIAKVFEYFGSVAEVADLLKVSDKSVYESRKRGFSPWQATAISLASRGKIKASKLYAYED